jgi:bacterioferritin
MRVKAGKAVIAALNDILTGELTSVNQYFLHARMLKNWGFDRLAERIRKESIDEMKHADLLIERILYLEGLPNVQKLGRIRIGENVPEVLASDLSVEQEAIPRLNQAIALCTTEGDHGTRVLLDGILRSEEEHLDWLETQLRLITEVGLQNYLAQALDIEG